MKDVVVEHAADLYSLKDRQSGKFVVVQSARALNTKITYKPYDARFWFTRYSPVRMPETVPVHEENDAVVPVVSSGDYSIGYQGDFVASYTLSIDLSKVSSWLGENTAVLYGVLTLDPSSSVTIPNNWEMTADVAEIFKWSALLFARAVRGTRNIPQAWFFKYVGFLIPNLGKIKLGFKLHGTVSSPESVVGLKLASNITVTELDASGELSGKTSFG